MTAGPEDCSRADGCEGRAGRAAAPGERIPRGKHLEHADISRTATKCDTQFLNQ